jgi:perosamine synthetase
VSRVAVGNTGFDLKAVNIGMSGVSHRLLPRFKYENIKATRQRNYRFLAERLREFAAMLPRTIDHEMCPLFFPLLVQDKQTAARTLWQHGVEAVEFWNEGDPEARRPGSAAEFLRRHVLEIPIHQDVTLSHLAYTADLIKKHRLHM